MYQALGTRSKDFDSEGNFELHQCRILDPLLFAMHLDEMMSSLLFTKDSMYQAISKYFFQFWKVLVSLRQPGNTETPPPRLLGTFPERPRYDQIEELTRKGY
jgi:hypothetical protein